MNKVIQKQISLLQECYSHLEKFRETLILFQEISENYKIDDEDEIDSLKKDIEKTLGKIFIEACE